MSCILGPTQVSSTNVILIGSAVFAGLMNATNTDTHTHTQTTILCL